MTLHTINFRTWSVASLFIGVCFFLRLWIRSSISSTLSSSWPKHSSYNSKSDRLGDPSKSWSYNTEEHLLPKSNRSQYCTTFTMQYVAAFLARSASDLMSRHLISVICHGHGPLCVLFITSISHKWKKLHGNVALFHIWGSPFKTLCLWYDLAWWNKPLFAWLFFFFV